MVLGAHGTVLGLPQDVSPCKPSFLSFLPLPLFLHLPPSFGTLVGMLNQSVDQFPVLREVTMGCQVMWMLWVWVAVERGGMGISVPPTHPLGCGACIMGCQTRFDVCMGCPPGCLVGVGTCLGATTDGGGAAALQQQ